MSTVNMIETIKKIHKEDIVLVKVGTFYTAYGKDAYIISYIFGYKLNKIQGIDSAAFPITSLNKVIAILEKNKVNYITLDKRNGYDVEEQSENKNLNNYNKILKKAKTEINYYKRIEKVVEELKEDKELLSEVEKLIYERRKI